MTKSNIELIYKPEAKSGLRRSVEFMITLVMWSVWIWMFSPLIVTLEWGFTDQMSSSWLLFAEQDEIRIRELIYELFADVSFVFIIIPLWVLLNIRRFRNRDRRKSLPDADHVARLADFHRVRPNLLQQLANEKEVVWRTSMQDVTDVTLWFSNRHGNFANPESIESSNASAASDDAIDSPAEPTLKAAVLTVCGSIMIIAVIILIIRWYEGMPVVFRL